MNSYLPKHHTFPHLLRITGFQCLGMIGKYDDERHFLSHLSQLHYEEGKLDKLIFLKIREQIKPNSLRTFSRIAIQCLKIDRKQHPTMAVIMEQLQMSLEFQIVSSRICEIRLKVFEILNRISTLGKVSFLLTFCS